MARCWRGWRRGIRRAIGLWQCGDHAWGQRIAAAAAHSERLELGRALLNPLFIGDGAPASPASLSDPDNSPAGLEHAQRD
jgi:hypothetical protein